MAKHDFLSGDSRANCYLRILQHEKSLTPWILSCFFLRNSSSPLVKRSKCIFILNFSKKTRFPGGSGESLQFHVMNRCLLFRRWVERNSVFGQRPGAEGIHPPFCVCRDHFPPSSLCSPLFFSFKGPHLWACRNSQRDACFKVNVVDPTSSWKITHLFPWEQLVVSRRQIFLWP